MQAANASRYSETCRDFPRGLKFRYYFSKLFVFNNLHNPPHAGRMKPFMGLDPVPKPSYTASIWNQNTDQRRYFIDLPMRFLRRDERIARQWHLKVMTT